MKYLNEPIYVFWACLLGHLIADFCLQGCLANLKQKDWWDEQIKEMKKKYGDEVNWEKYKNDYFMGGVCHAMMWSIITFLPMLPTLSPIAWSYFVLFNWIIHYIIDDQKANRKKITLEQDQQFHFAQIVISLVIWGILR